MKELAFVLILSGCFKIFANKEFWNLKGILMTLKMYVWKISNVRNMWLPWDFKWNKIKNLKPKGYFVLLWFLNRENYYFFMLWWMATIKSTCNRQGGREWGLVCFLCQSQHWSHKIGPMSNGNTFLMSNNEIYPMIKPWYIC